MNLVNDSLSPAGIVTSLFRHRSLIRQLAAREIASRYRGSLMGFFWTLLNPLLMLVIYTFVFRYVFQARWGLEEAGDGVFAINLFCGLIVHAFFAECINRAPVLITNNSNYVKKVVFPLEIFPWVTVSAAGFHALMSLLVLTVVNLVLSGAVPLTIVWLPVVVAPYVLFAAGVVWLFAALGVFLRDIRQLMGVLTTALLFLSPIFYPVAALPERLQPLIYLNPLTLIIEQMRAIVLWGRGPDLAALGVYLVVAAGVAVLGFAVFQKSRRGFADVI